MENNKIKLFVDAHVFDREFQGTQTFLRELYRKLLNDRTDLDIYFGAVDTENIRKIFPEVPLSHILPYKKRRYPILRLFFDIPDYIRKGGFDFAHFQYITPPAIPGCRYIVTLHDILFNDFKEDFTFPFRFSRNLLFKNSFKQAAIKTTVSHYSKQRISQHYHLSAKEIHVIENAANEHLDHTQYTRQEALLAIQQKYGMHDFLLCVSRIEPRKNQHLLLKTYLDLRLYERGISLVLIGVESAPVEALNRLIRSMNEEQSRHVHWIKQVDQSELVQFYMACRLFIYPSKAEGFGIPPLEAAVCRAPVLCSSATAMKDFSFFDPYTFDPANEEEFQQKLLDMALAPPTLAFREEVARQALTLYNWEKSSTTFYQLLKKEVMPYPLNTIRTSLSQASL